MIKKIFVGLTITLILAIGVFGVVKTTYAQEVVDIPVNTYDTTTIPEPETLEYEYMNQDGPLNGDIEAVQTQTRTRLFEMQEGECDGTCDPQQLREQIGLENAGVMRQERVNDGTFDCDGDCVPQQLGLGEGNNGYGAQRQLNMTADGTCDGTGIPQSRGMGGNGK